MLSNDEKQIKFGKNIAKLRKLKGFTQNQLAEILDISREHLAKIETAKRGISINLLYKLSDALNIEEKEFFNFN